MKNIASLCALWFLIFTLPIALLAETGMRRASQPAEVAFYFTIEIVGRIPVAVRLAHIAAEPRGNSASFCAAEL